ncbi:MAG: helix-turn-helix domain-containing protein [Bacteroidales bacterium]
MKKNLNEAAVLDEQNLQAIGPKRVLNLAECCALTGYKKGHIYRLTSTRQIPHSKRGKTLFFLREEVEAWMMGNRIATVSELDAAAGAYLVKHPKK